MLLCTSLFVDMDVFTLLCVVCEEKKAREREREKKSIKNVQKDFYQENI